MNRENKLSDSSDQTAADSKPSNTPSPHSKPSSYRRQPRRSFLEKCLAACGGIGFLCMSYPVLRYIEPPPETEGPNRIEIDSAELPTGTSTMVIYRGRPTLVVHGPDGFIAYSAVCPHLGCVVKWTESDEEFHCPCHGGRFDIKGQKLGGPVPGPLTAIKVQEVGNKILVGA